MLNTALWDFFRADMTVIKICYEPLFINMWHITGLFFIRRK